MVTRVTIVILTDTNHFVNDFLLNINKLYIFHKFAQIPLSGVN